MNNKITSSLLNFLIGDLLLQGRRDREFLNGRRLASNRLASLLSLFAFSFLAVNSVAIAQEIQTEPHLARQILLPSFAKTDWQGSSFSSDALFLLVVDDERSFFLDVHRGQEIRGVKLLPDEKLIWSRPISNSYQWIAVTNQGKFVRIDAASGVHELILDISSITNYSDYRSGTISFEFITESEIAAFIETSRERKTSSTTERFDDLLLIAFSIVDGAVLGSSKVSSETFFSNLDGRVVANVGQDIVAVFDPASHSPIAIWRVDRTARGITFRSSCKFEEFYSEGVAALIPHKEGFLALSKNNIAAYIGPELFNTPTCGTPKPLVASSPALGKECRQQLSNNVVTAWAMGQNRILAITQELDVLELEFSTFECSLVSSPVTNIKDLYHPYRIYKNFTDKLETGDISAEGFVIGMGQSDYVLVASGTLVKFKLKGQPFLLATLVGKPTGVFEVESARGFLVGNQLFAPLKIFDTQASTSKSIKYDHATYYKNTFVYNKPFAIARAIGAIAVIEYNGHLTFHAATSSVNTAFLPKAEQLDVKSARAICVSDDGNRVLVSEDGNVLRLFERSHFSQSLKSVAQIPFVENVHLFTIACDATATLSVVADSINNKAFVVERRADRLIIMQTLEVPSTSSSRIDRPSLSRDTLYLGIVNSLFVRAKDTKRFEKLKDYVGAERLVFNEKSDKLLVLGKRTSLFQVRDSAKKTRPKLIKDDFGTAFDGAFLDDDNVVILRGTQELEFLSIVGHSLGRLVFGEGEDWMFSDTYGRFDLNDLENQTTGYWLMPDDPLHLLPPEVFMRDYFEPRMLSRILNCRRQEQRGTGSCRQEFKPIRPLSELNRAQPEVEIVSIDPEPGKADQVTVTVEVRGIERHFGDARTGRNLKSGAFDLRLFRQGQLVRRSPEALTPEADSSLSQTEIQRWRDRHRLIESVGTVRVPIRNVQLPHMEKGSPVEFSAYAFNRDRVKSATDYWTHQIDETIPVRRRAYVIAVGVSAYQDLTWDLRYAANDAKRLVNVLVPRLRATGQFEEVVPLTLTSEWIEEEESGKRSVIKSDTTKANIKSVMDALSGTTPSSRLSETILQEMKLQKSTPDDMVIVLFSGHGFSDGSDFYLLPYDTEKKDGEKTKAPAPQSAISSSELSFWLREVVANEIILIIDACHSAASVDSGEFKPGPMGSRGLGQLAYDKRMMILASTRANDLAWESSTIRQGLLSYALVHDGLEKGRADFLPSDGRISGLEWLSFGVDRVPKLYSEKIRQGDKSKARLTIFDSLSRQSRAITVDGIEVGVRTQQPALFNYYRDRNSMLISR